MATLAPEFKNIADTLLEQIEGFSHKVEARSAGTVDAVYDGVALVSGLADAIVEVTETGSTIRAHGLKIIHDLMKTNTQLIANKESYGDPWKKSKIEQILLLLRGALRAEDMVGLKMNLPRDKVEAVMTLLPSLNAPTVASLYNSDWASVEIIVESRIVRDLIPRLIKAGAEGIIEYPLNKVI